MKRRAFKLIVFLLAGAIINVAVAWGCAVFAPLASLQTDKSGKHTWPENRPTEFPPLATNRGSLAQFGLSRSIQTACVVKLKEIEKLKDAILSVKSDVHSSGAREARERLANDLMLLQPGDPGMFSYTSLSAGWPAHAFEGGRWQWLLLLDPPSASQQRFRLDRSIDLADYPAIANSDPSSATRLLPLKTIWPGFAINTILYAAVLWMLFAFPFVIRRVRIKRGQCASCGYSLHESVSEECSECGAAVQRAR
jgi:hypothetical protein